MKLKHLFAVLVLAFTFIACEEEQPIEIAVTKVTVTPATITMNGGETKQLKAEVLPVDATNATVTWKSSNESVATVSNDGTVKAINGGTATISAMAGGKTGSCSVTVTISAASIEISDSAISFTAVGETKQLTATVKPDNASNKTVTWSSSNKDVATVSDKGLVTSVGNGETTITATCGTLTATCKISVAVVATSVELSESTINFTEAGKTIQLTATVKPEEAVDKNVVWASSNEAAATVSQTGLVTSIANGKATITATCGAVSATCEVDVTIAADIVKIDGDTASFDIDGATSDQINDAIKKATEAGATKFVFNGDCSALNLANDANVFSGISIGVLDLSGVTNWPTYNGDPSVPSQAFYSTSGAFNNIKEIILPDAIKTIDSYAFYKCTGLTKVTAKGVTAINSNAFSNCTSLSEVDMPDVISIGSNAFFKAALTTANFEKVSSVSASAFWMCTSLTEVNMPACKTIGAAGSGKTGAFSDCTSLTTVNMPNVEIIGDGSFAYCSALTSVDMPSATTIGAKAYLSCKALVDIKLPKVTTIYEYAFNTCNAMATLVLTSPDTITIKSTSNSFGAYSNDTKDMDLTINTNKQSEVGSDTFGDPTWNGFTWKSISYVE